MLSEHVPNKVSKGERGFGRVKHEEKLAFFDSVLVVAGSSSFIAGHNDAFVQGSRKFTALKVIRII